MTKQEFQGKTLDEALAAAARTLGTDVNLLSYNILPQSSGGLFSKLFQRGVRLEAWIDSKNDIQAAAREAVRQAMSGNEKDKPQPRDRGHQERNKQNRSDKQEQNRHVKSRQGADQNRSHANRPEPQSRKSNENRREQTHKRPHRDHEHDLSNNLTSEQLAERQVRPRMPLNSTESKNLLVELAEKFVSGFDPGTKASPKLDFITDEEVVVSVEAPNLEEMLVRSDRLSCAFEHLFKRIAQKQFADVSGRVALNAGTAAEQREQKLRDMALDVAAKVKETGKTITLSSKSSQERRVIHLALEHMEGIATKSVGIGENRKLVVYSTLKPPRGQQDGRPRSNNNRPRHHGARTEMNAQTNTEEGTAGEDGQGGHARRRSRRRGRRGGSPRNAHQNRTEPGYSSEPQTQDSERENTQNS